MGDVRAKFRCVSVTNKEGSRKIAGTQDYERIIVSEILMQPVFDGSNNPENTKFFNATPYGELKMGVVNPEAAKSFIPGKEYYLDFTKVE